MVNENLVKDVVKEPYKYGFVTDIETEKIERGLNEDIIRLISKKKEEPKFLLDFRLKAFKKWQKMKEPDFLITGSSGNTREGQLVTFSGGARG